MTSNTPFFLRYKQRRANSGAVNSLPIAMPALRANGCCRCRRAYCNVPCTTRGSPNNVVPNERSPSALKNGQSAAVAPVGTMVCPNTTGCSSHRSSTSRSCTLDCRGRPIMRNSSGRHLPGSWRKRSTRNWRLCKVSLRVSEPLSDSQSRMTGDGNTLLTCTHQRACLTLSGFTDGFPCQCRKRPVPRPDTWRNPKCHDRYPQ